MSEISFFLCTRDRSEIVEKHLDSIDRALLQTNAANKALYFIVDDNTQQIHKKRLLSLVNSNKYEHLQLYIIDDQVHNHILDQIALTGQEFVDLFSRRTKKLGTGTWDLASTRNLAFLCAYILAGSSTVVTFFDDDMILDNIYYEGYQYYVDGANILDELYNATHKKALHAAGCGYWGRTDISILKHLLHILEVVNRSDSLTLIENMYESLLDFPNKLPVRIDTPTTAPEGSAGPGPGGISGAVLAVTQACLRSHFVPQVYNEDWIWLLFLGDVRYPVTRISRNVVHAAPPQATIPLNFIHYQEYGEVLYQTLANVNSDLPEGSDKLDWFKNHTSTELINIAKAEEIGKVMRCIELVSLLKSAKQSSSEIGRSLERLDGILSEILQGLEQIDPGGMLHEISQYIDDIRTWRKMLDFAHANITIDFI